MDIRRIMCIMDASYRTRRTIEHSLHEIDRRALNAMVLVKRHGNKLAGYGVVAQAFREQASHLKQAAAAPAALHRPAGAGAYAHPAASPLCRLISPHCQRSSAQGRLPGFWVQMGSWQRRMAAEKAEALVDSASTGTRP